MPVIDSERLGVLWRSQGQAFLDEQAAELQGDVERLRDAYLALAKPTTAEAPSRRRLRVPRVVDLRDTEPEVVGEACATDGHGDVAAAIRCSRCHKVYCRNCTLQSTATHEKPLCTECALIVSGVHHKRSRPLVAQGRPRR